MLYKNGLGPDPSFHRGSFSLLIRVNKYCLITITIVWNIGCIMAAIRLILTLTQGLTVAALKTSIVIYIMRGNFLAIQTELFRHSIYMDYINLK